MGGDGGGDSQFRGRTKGWGGHCFLGERVGGTTFPAREKENIVF
jgi:hypothetical protein